jgi:hypothetical protein
MFGGNAYIYTIVVEDCLQVLCHSSFSSIRNFNHEINTLSADIGYITLYVDNRVGIRADVPSIKWIFSLLFYTTDRLCINGFKSGK